jgi:Flp pilus assembly protein TadG
MTTLRQRSRTRRRGAQAVEFALVAPLFFLFIFALVDIGRGMMVVSLLNNAARAGVRVGAIPGKSNSDIQTAVNQMATGQRLSGTTTTITVNGAAQDASTAQSGDSITVTVSAPASSVTWLPVQWFINGTLRGQFTLPRE